MGICSTRRSDLLPSIESNTLHRLDKGRYINLDQPSNVVRSTISIAFSHDNTLFASTHGDHTVKAFEYPSGFQVACLEGHPRTPWTVRFHPSNHRLVASGCLGSECRVWDVVKGVCLRKFMFRNSISCVSFSPCGSVLAVTSGRQLLMWEYWRDDDGDWGVGMEDVGRERNSDGDGSSRPREILEGVNPFHMVDFHPSGTLLMTGEKNKYPPASTTTVNTTTTTTTTTAATTTPANTNNNENTNGNVQTTTTTTENTNNVPTTAAPAPAATAEEQQFTLRLVIHRFDRRLTRRYTDPVLEIPRVVAYNDAGIHFSPCGTMLAACIPSNSNFKIAILSLTARSHRPIGSVMYEHVLDKGHVTALTNLKFSACGKHLLAGFSFRPNNPVLESGGGDGVRVVDIYELGKVEGEREGELKRVSSLRANVAGGGAEDEINVAMFGGESVADGVVYGTQKGRIRMFAMETGRIGYADKGEDGDVEEEAVEEDVECVHGDGDLELGSDEDDVDVDEEEDDEFIGLNWSAMHHGYDLVADVFGRRNSNGNENTTDNGHGRGHGNNSGNDSNNRVGGLSNDDGNGRFASRYNSL